MTTTAMYPPKTPPRRTKMAQSPYHTPPRFSQGRRKPGFSLSGGTPNRRSNKLSPARGTARTPSSGNDDLSGNDRFIPSRHHMNTNVSLLLESEKKRKPPRDDETPLQKEFKRRMLSTMCGVPLENLSENAEPSGIFSYGRHRSFNSKAQFTERISTNPFSLDVLRTMPISKEFEEQVASKVVRKVPSAPVRILDAPDLIDDYYLSLISWSKDNILAVALARSVYLWNAATGEIHHLVTVTGVDYITAVNWCKDQPKYLAVGTHLNDVHLYDGHALRKVRTLTGATGRIASLSWNAQTVSAGDRDAVIRNHDVRIERHTVSTYKGHTQEVCGLKWSDDGSALASGGNENYLCVWDAAMSGRSDRFGRNGPSEHGPRLTLQQHKAAVKAIDWCPFHRGLLASGGGTADRTIKFWNASSGALLNSIDTGSQVCSIVWSRHQRELCSSHGYSENQLILWKYPTMTKVKELTGHTARVLHMDLSPDGGSIVSAGADETLRFWNIFDTPTCRENAGCLGELSLGGPTIR